MQSEEGVHLTEEQLHRRINQWQEERSQLEQEFNNGQDRFDRVKVKQDSMYAYLKEQRDLVHEQLDKLEEQEFQMEGMHHSIKKKFDEDMEDVTLKISKLKNLEKQTRGVIQQHLDKIEIKNRDNLVVIQKQQREVDRVSKKMLIKKLEFENMERAVEDLRAEVLRMEQEKEGAEKTLSTLKRTRTSYYKPNKSVNKSPWKSCSPTKQKKKLVKLKSNNEYGVVVVTESPHESENMQQISLFNSKKETTIKLKTPAKKPSKKRFSLKRKLTLI